MRHELRLPGGVDAAGEAEAVEIVAEAEALQVLNQNAVELVLVRGAGELVIDPAVMDALDRVAGPLRLDKAPSRLLLAFLRAADRVVTENESKKPKEDDPKIAAVQTSASTESVAAEATATPSSEAIPEGQRSVAPVLGTGESARRARATWQKELVAHLDKHKRYPKERQQKSAEIQIRFTLDRLGHVLSTDIEKGSGDTAFDEAALAMVRRSDPVPMPPPVIADEGLTFTLPVIFRVKTKS